MPDEQDGAESDGFLGGLGAQESELTAMMDRLAKSMVASMRREIGERGAPAGVTPVTVHVSGFTGSEQRLVEELYRAVQEESVRYRLRRGATRTAAVLVTVYVSIGNSDDKLTQARWSAFHERVTLACRNYARQVFGQWLSAPASEYQNACIAFAIEADEVSWLKKELASVAESYEQDSIAWAEAVTEFIGPRQAES